MRVGPLPSAFSARHPNGLICMQYPGQSGQVPARRVGRRGITSGGQAVSVTLGYSESDLVVTESRQHGWPRVLNITRLHGHPTAASARDNPHPGLALTRQGRAARDGAPETLQVPPRPRLSGTSCAAGPAGAADCPHAEASGVPTPAQRHGCGRPV